jgi:hypothetical protein
MRRVVLVVLAALALGSPVWAQKPADVEKAIFEASGAFRKKKSVGPLVREATLDTIAQKHAQAMARVDRYGDDDKNGHVLDGKGPMDRVKEGGYKFALMAENVGWNKGFRSPSAKIMKDWIGSPPHHKNLVQKDVTETGIGAARGRSGRWYFVQLFARPASQQTTVKVAIENRTKDVIKFRIGSGSGARDYELKAGQKGTYHHHQPTDKVPIRIIWPDSDTPSTSDLADQASYAFVEKKGKFAFEKVGSLP